jgi:spermidine/putrescine transport system permease protein
VRRSLGFYAAAVFLFLYAPLLILIAFSFNSARTSVWEHFSWHWYGQVFHDAQIAESTLNSAVIAVLASALSTVIGTVAAYALWKKRAPVFSSGLYLSLVTPEIVTGVSLLAFFQWIFHWMHWHLGLFTVVLAHVAFSIAYIAIVVSARLKAFDPALEEAALDLGATDWQAFVRVTLPFLWPGIFAAALLALIVSFDDYVITSLVAGVDSETLPMVVYAMARRGTNPALNAISTLIVVFFGGLILLSEKVRKA